ncbi:MAG: O-antigen ligase family protein [Chloroflexi bacterium]|nr:O-antigen ligase family protein [Chloroflexota bacterium]
MLTRFCQWLLQYEWVLLILILPLVLFPTPQRAWVLLLIPLLWLVRKIATSHFVPITPLNWSLFGLLLMVLVSLYATFDMTHSFVKIAGLIYGIAVFFAAVTWVGDSYKRLWWGVTGLLAAGLGIAGLGLLAVRLRTKIPLLANMVALLPARIESGLGGDKGINPNEISGVLLWMTPLALTLAIGGVLYVGRLRQRVRPSLITPLLLLLVGTAVTLLSILILTQSRSAYLGLVAAVLFTGAVLIAAHSWRWLLGGTAALLFISLLAATQIESQQLTAQIFLQVGIEEDGLSTLAGRLEIWSRALYGIQDFPFTGMGMNNFRRVVHILYPLFLISPDTDIAHAHNHLFQAALDLGIPGLVAYLALWLGMAGMLWHTWRRSDDVFVRLLVLGFASSLVAYFVYGLTDAVALGARPGFIFWFLLGLITALHQTIWHEAKTGALRET